MDRDANDFTWYPTRHAAAAFPRTQMEINNWGAFNFVEESGRWLALPWTASGLTDQQMIYRMSDVQWRGDVAIPEPGCGHIGDCGYPCAGCQTDPNAAGPGHRQASVYLPGHPLETLRQTNLRFYRHSVESSINSFGGGQESRLAPWLELINSRTSRPLMNSEDDLRPILAMLRAKNLEQAILWTDNNGDFGTYYADGWLRTSQLLKDVYAPRVEFYAPWAGSFVEGVGDDWDASRLEFTLRVEDSDRLVGLTAEAEAPTELLVQFTGLDDYYVADEESICFDFTINVECSTDQSDTVGLVKAWNWAASEWVIVPTEEGITYGFYAPSATFDAPFDFQTRRTFHLQAYSIVSSDGKMILDFVHTSASAHSSFYDLVQIIPTAIECTGGGEGRASRATQSDANYDGVVTSADLAIFMGNYLAQRSCADVNLDGEINSADVSYFMAHYTNGN